MVTNNERLNDMYYRTYINQTNFIQYTVDDLYNNVVQPTDNFTNTQTIRVENIPPAWLNNSQTYNQTLTTFFDNHPVDIVYTQYHIPKHSGGYRLISAPSNELKEVQKELYTLLCKMGAYAHDAAYAYVKERTCLQAIQKHRDKNTEYFYKFDLDNFFPSCTTQLLKEQLKQVYPFCMFTEENLNKIIHIATYHNVLPQGSSLSPLLCNMVLLPFDWHMFYSIKHFDGVYTRYADDILISFKYRKELNFVARIVARHLPTGLTLNTDKSRCGSIKGHNYNLGLVLNKDHNITIGHKRKMELKAKINNFIFDFTNRNYWSIIETQVLQGELNYFKQIEPQYAAFVIQRLESKHHSQSITSMFADIISGRV